MLVITDLTDNKFEAFAKLQIMREKNVELINYSSMKQNVKFSFNLRANLTQKEGGQKESSSYKYCDDN